MLEYSTALEINALDAPNESAAKIILPASNVLLIAKLSFRDFSNKSIDTSSSITSA